MEIFTKHLDVAHGDMIQGLRWQRSVTGWTLFFLDLNTSVDLFYGSKINSIPKVSQGITTTAWFERTDQSGLVLYLNIYTGQHNAKINCF